MKRIPIDTTTGKQSGGDIDVGQVEREVPVSACLAVGRLAALLAPPLLKPEVVEVYTSNDFSPEELVELFGAFVGELAKGATCDLHASEGDALFP